MIGLSASFSVDAWIGFMLYMPHALCLFYIYYSSGISTWLSNYISYCCMECN